MVILSRETTVDGTAAKASECYTLPTCLGFRTAGPDHAVVFIKHAYKLKRALFDPNARPISYQIRKCLPVDQSCAYAIGILLTDPIDAVPLSDRHIDMADARPAS